MLVPVRHGIIACSRGIADAQRGERMSRGLEMQVWLRLKANHIHYESVCRRRETPTCRVFHVAGFEHSIESKMPINMQRSSSEMVVIGPLPCMLRIVFRTWRNIPMYLTHQPRGSAHNFSYYWHVCSAEHRSTQKT